MNTQLLLRLVAHGAGYLVDEQKTAEILREDPPMAAIAVVGDRRWNPLKDDAQAWSLLADVRLDVQWEDILVSVCTVSGEKIKENFDDHIDPSLGGPDECAALRHAVVKAAAIVGFHTLLVGA